VSFSTYSWARGGLLGGETGCRWHGVDIAAEQAWCGHVLRGDDDGWVRRCVECEVGGSGQGVREPGGRLSESTVGCVG